MANFRTGVGRRVCRCGLSVVAVAVLLAAVGCGALSSLGGSDSKSSSASSSGTATTTGTAPKQVQGTMKPTLVMYSSSNASSLAMAPVVDSVIKPFGTKIGLVRIDADKDKSAAKENNVEKTPTFIGYVGGKEVKRLVGVQTPKAMNGLLQAMMQGK